MRTLLFAAFITVATTTGAFAYCPAIPGDTTADNIENQTALTLCQQAELSATVERQAAAAHLQAELDAQRQQFELEQKLQQTFAAASQVTSSPALWPPF